MSCTAGRPMHTAIVTIRRPYLLVAALVAVTALAAAGCGGSSIVVPELTSFTSVARKSASADSARFALELSMTVPGAAKPVSFSATGAFDTPAERSQVTVDLSSVAELLTSAGSSLGGTTTGGLGSPADWKLDTIQDGQTAYIHFPLLANELPEGKTWIKGDAAALAGAHAGRLSRFGSLAGTDPRDTLAMLKAVSGSIEAVGSDTIRGVETSHYRATIDTAKLEQLVPAAQRQTLGGLDQGAKQAGLTQIPLDVWIGADQLVRKLSVDVDTTQPGTGQAVKASFVVELYDYGQPLDLQLPPADQVVDASTLKPTA